MNGNKTIISVKNLVKKFGDFTANDNLSFEVYEAAGPGVVRKCGGEPGFYRIFQHVGDGYHEVRIILDQHSFVTILKHISPTAMRFPIMPGVLSVELLEKVRHFS